MPDREQLEHQPDIDLSLDPNHDDLFQQSSYPVPFEFNDEVVAVFDNMALRSIPLYTEVTRAILYWSQRHYIPGTEIVDLGCSTGTTLALIAKGLFASGTQASFTGIDTSKAMLDKAQSKAEQWSDFHSFTWSQEDAREFKFPKSSVVILNYTLQFIPVRDRLPLLQSIYEALVPGGIMVVSDKVRHPNASFFETTTNYYESFKLRNGYSRSEIERKKEALDQVLIPLSMEEQTEMLQSAGFRTNDTIMKWHNFVTTISLKE